jgi:hypothetical protein
MAAFVENTDGPVVLTCDDSMFVAVIQSVLMKESTVFRAEIRATYQNSNSGGL